MLFYNKREISYEKHFKTNAVRMITNKQNNTNKYVYIYKPIVKIFFWFKKIKEEDLDFLKLFNHFILLWLITSQKAIIKKLDSTLNKGIRYFKCIFYLYIKNIFLFFNFLNETLLPIMNENAKKVHYKKKNEHLYSFSDFGSFTNLRLSSNLYLNSVHDRLFVFIKIRKNIQLNLNIFLNLLKQ